MPESQQQTVVFCVETNDLGCNAINEFGLVTVTVIAIVAVTAIVAAPSLLWLVFAQRGGHGGAGGDRVCAMGDGAHD